MLHHLLPVFEGSEEFDRHMGDGVYVRHEHNVMEKNNKSIFYMTFFSLSVLAKLLLVGIIIYSIVIVICPGGRMPRPVLYPLPSVRRR